MEGWITELCVRLTFQSFSIFHVLIKSLHFPAWFEYFWAWVFEFKFSKWWWKCGNFLCGVWWKISMLSIACAGGSQKKIFLRWFWRLNGLLIFNLIWNTVVKGCWKIIFKAPNLKLYDNSKSIESHWIAFMNEL